MENKHPNFTEGNYPTTYDECCEVLGLHPIERPTAFGYRAVEVEALQKLLVCKDAWWKVWGEEVPELEAGNTRKYHYLLYGNTYVYIGETTCGSCVLFFPTRELACAFKDTFLETILEAKLLI